MLETIYLKPIECCSCCHCINWDILDLIVFGGGGLAILIVFIIWAVAGER